MHLPRRTLSTFGVLAASLLAVPGTAAAADLSVSAPVRDDADALTVGSIATYEVHVTNNGPDDTDATATVTLGEAEELVEVASGQGSCTTGAPVVCELGSIIAGGSAVIRTQVRFTRTSAANAHRVRVSGPAGSVDPDESNDEAAQVNPVTERSIDDGATPLIRIEDWSRTQSRLKLEAEVSAPGQGEVHFEYGRTKSYGSRTTPRKVTGDSTVKATLAGLRMNTAYHFRAVLVVGGKTYRSRDTVGRTMGKLKFANLTLKATSRRPSSVAYTGQLGDGFADAPGACKGTVKVIVMTLQGAELLVKSTRMKSDCTFKITVPFGRKQASRYGKRGNVLAQARFSGSKAVSPVGSDPDRP